MFYISQSKEQSMSRKHEILALMAKGEINDQLFAELKQIKAAEEQAKVDRQNQIAGAIKGLVASGVSFAELMEAQFEGQPVFKTNEIVAFVQNKGIKITKGAGATAGGTRVAKDHGITLFEFPKPTRGQATKIGSKTQRLNLTKSMIDLVEKGGDVKANLMALAVKTPEAQQFLSTTQGQATVDAWVNHMKNNLNASKAALAAAEQKRLQK